MARKFQMGIAAMVHTQSPLLLPRNGHSVPFIRLRESLPSQVASISPICGSTVRFIFRFRSADGTEADIEMALHEALANAVIHGNGENSRKRIYVTCRCYMDGEVSLTRRRKRIRQQRGAGSHFSRNPADHAWSRDLSNEDANGRNLVRGGRISCADAKKFQRWCNPAEEIRMNK